MVEGADCRSPCRTILPGLSLHEAHLSPEAQQAAVAFAREALADGRAGRLHGKSWVPRPPQWADSGQGRETVHYGALVKFNKLLDAAVEPLPPPLLALLDGMQAAGIFTAAERPDTCCLNAYAVGSWLPPHVDSPAFARPFFSLSLLSEQPAVFGEHIGGEGGEWTGEARFALPPGSVLRVDGRAAGPECQHAMPRASDERISLIFRQVTLPPAPKLTAGQLPPPSLCHS